MNTRNQKSNAANSYVILLFALFAVGVAPGSSAPAYGQQNDNFADAIEITSLPYAAQVDISQATFEWGSEPYPSCFAFYPAKTVWYKFTPATNVQIRADLNGFGVWDTFISVLQGTDLSSLATVACVSTGGSGNSVTFWASAGQTYYFQLGSSYSSGILQVNVNEVLPPANDNFENASVISALPFQDSQDTTAATSELGEPTPSCVYSNPVGATIWYSFTPAESISISTYVANPMFATFVAAYARNGGAGLMEIGCQNYYGMLTFRAEAGVTYYFQAGGMYSEKGLLSFRLEPAPLPTAYFYFNPIDPSVFDAVQFSDASYDPAGVGIASRSWDFGDGTAAEGSYTTHKYAQDGDYTVGLTVSTSDGRTRSTSQVVHVQTHDIAITRFVTPNAASSGQTRAITVGINSKRYPEYVTVQIQKGVPGGGYQVYEVIGTLTQSVPVRSSNRTIDFNFSYTFTLNDAAVGKVVFKAVASIGGVRDALSADNEATAFPTKVSR